MHNIILGRGKVLYLFHKLFIAILIKATALELSTLLEEGRNILLEGEGDEEPNALCNGGKKKRYISPEWLKRKRCELKLSRWQLLEPRLRWL